MKIAYLIAAHKLPGQLARLLESLNSEDVHFFLHIDKSSDLKLFKESLKDFPPGKVTYIKRERARWGTFGMVQATLNGLEAIVENKEIYDFVFLLSGQDYPIKSNDYIFNFLKQNKEKSFISYHHIPFENWHLGGLDRLRDFHFYIGNRYFTYPSPNKKLTLKRKLLYFLFKLYFKKPRIDPLYLKPFGGSQWFCLNQEAINYVLNFVSNNRDFGKFHKYSLLPDEIFFQTIMLNSQEDKILKSIENQSLTYANWDSPKTPLPALLESSDFEVLIKSDKLFARKFDIAYNFEILDKLDEFRSKI